MMKRKRWTSATAIMLAAALMLTGCGGSDGNTDQPDSSTDTDGAVTQGEGEKAGETTVLTIAMQENPNVIDFDTNYLVNRLEEACNVDLQLISLPADGTEFNQKISMMMTSGEKLPDIICAEFSKETAAIYGSQGFLIPLNEYYADETKSVYMHENIPGEEFEWILDQVTAPDGNIYTVPLYTPEINNQYNHLMWINQTWLDALGLDMPVTTDDLYNVLKAFKEQDPNGNGKADEIPMMGCKNGYMENPIPFLMNAYVYADSRNSYVYVEDGKIVPAFTSEEWKEGLAYINKLVSEGLLSPQTFTQDATQFRPIMENEECQLLGSVPMGYLGMYVLGSERAADMVPLPPLTGPEGACNAIYNPDSPRLIYFITKDCENPDLAFAVADYGFEKEMSMISRYGKQGENWDTNIEGLENPTAKELGVDLTWHLIRDDWTVPQNNHLGGWNPTYRGLYDPWSTLGMGKAENDPNPYWSALESVPLHQNKHPEEVITGYTFTEEENSEIAALRADIDTFVNESTTRFVVGDQPLSEWDNYLETLNSMGLDRYLELLQSGYDRASGK